MKINRGLLILIIVVVFLSQTQSIKACTIFSVTLDDGTVLACNNEDWMYSIGNTVIICAPDSENYGRVCFYNSSYVQGGMNEYGLFYDGASCPATKIPYDKEKKDLDFDLGETALAKCKTVKEVEEFFSSYNIPDGFYDHLLFADEFDNVAVFEWVEDEFHVIWKDPQKKYQVITNFWLSDPTLGGYPCSRYDTAEEILSTEKITYGICENILTKTKQDWGDGGTLYSNICNLNKREVCLFYRGEAKQTVQINLMDELKTMEAGTCEIMNMEEICGGEAPEEEEVLNTDLELKENEIHTAELESKEIADSINSEEKDNKKVAYKVVTVSVGLLFVAALIVKKLSGGRS